MSLSSPRNLRLSNKFIKVVFQLSVPLSFYVKLLSEKKCEKEVIKPKAPLFRKGNKCTLPQTTEFLESMQNTGTVYCSFKKKKKNRFAI